MLSALGCRRPAGGHVVCDGHVTADSCAPIRAVAVSQDQRDGRCCDDDQLSRRPPPLCSRTRQQAATWRVWRQLSLSRHDGLNAGGHMDLRNCSCLGDRDSRPAAFRVCGRAVQGQLHTAAHLTNQAELARTGARHRAGRRTFKDNSNANKSKHDARCLATLTALTGTFDTRPIYTDLT